MASNSPRITKEKAADYVYSVAAAFSSDVALTAIATKPKFAAQLVIFTNAHATAAQNAVFIAEDGTTVTMVVPPLTWMKAHTAIKTLDATGTGDNISAVAYWWAGGSIDVNR